MFDAKKATEEIVEFIRDYYKKNNLKGAVLGISGGKDSGVVTALMTEALGSENVVGLTLPCHSQDKDAALAKKVADYYHIKLLNIDLTNAFDVFKDEVLKLAAELNAKNKILIFDESFIYVEYFSKTSSTSLPERTSFTEELITAKFCEHISNNERKFAKAKILPEVIKSKNLIKEMVKPDILQLKKPKWNNSVILEKRIDFDSIYDLSILNNRKFTNYSFNDHERTNFRKF